MAVLSKREYMDNYNRQRRERRRMEHECEGEESSWFKQEPSLQEIKNALRGVGDSHLTIIWLAALMNNLWLYHSYWGEIGGGLRKHLEKDGYLASRYDTLMRYKRLGDAIRGVAGIDLVVNLLWGFSDYSPKDEDEAMFLESYDDDIKKLKNLYASCEGMNFKQIKERMK